MDKTFAEKVFYIQNNLNLRLDNEDEKDDSDDDDGNCGEYQVNPVEENNEQEKCLNENIPEPKCELIASKRNSIVANELNELNDVSKGLSSL